MTGTKNSIRSHVEDGRLAALLAPKLAVHFIKGVDAEANRAAEELFRLRDMLESEEE